MNWYIKDEIIYVRYSGVITVDELRDCLTKMRAFIESSPRGLVHFIMDVGDIVEPVGLSDTLKLVRELGSHPRLGWSLSLREKSVLVKMGISFGSSIFKTRFRTFDTLDQAVAHLKLFDEGLSWDKVDNSVFERTET